MRLSGIPEDEIGLYVDMFRMMNRRLAELREQFVLALTTGMRRGELLGLRWSDVDLEAGRIQITQAMRYASGRPEVAAPKTRTARRTITP